MCTTSARNIVGVVLQCNGYEVIDLGVMDADPEDPGCRQGAQGQHHRSVGPDYDRLLDEMVTVASEMGAPRASTFRC